MTRFFESEDKAFSYMASRNGRTARARDYVVLVDGPETGYAVMPIKDAQDAGFLYRIAW